MLRTRIAAAFCLALLLFAGMAAAGNEEKKGFDHSRWGEVLKAHVSEGRVDYAAIKKENQEDLDAYLASLARADLSKLNRNERIALYVNA